MMFTSVHARAASAYRRTGVASANPAQVVGLLFDGLLQSMSSAIRAIESRDVARKGEEIAKSVRLIEEGLKMGLDLERGGEIASNLRGLYDYSVIRLTQANLRNDPVAITEVIKLIMPVADGWKKMQGGHAGEPSMAAASALALEA